MRTARAAIRRTEGDEVMAKPTKFNAKARVELGTKWLDEVIGPDWPKLIDLGRYKFSTWCGCTVGQVAQKTRTPEQLEQDKSVGRMPEMDYMAAYSVAHRFAEEHGLHSLYSEAIRNLGFMPKSEDESEDEMRFLERRWKAEIKKRQEVK
jgi:hypothetical protein